MLQQKVLIHILLPGHLIRCMQLHTRQLYCFLHVWVFFVVFFQILWFSFYISEHVDSVCIRLNCAIFCFNFRMKRNSLTSTCSETTMIQKFLQRPLTTILTLMSTSLSKIPYKVTTLVSIGLVEAGNYTCGIVYLFTKLYL